MAVAEYGSGRMAQVAAAGDMRGGHIVRVGADAAVVVAAAVAAGAGSGIGAADAAVDTAGVRWDMDSRIENVVTVMAVVAGALVGQSAATEGVEAEGVIVAPAGALGIDAAADAAAAAGPGFRMPRREASCRGPGWDPVSIGSVQPQPRRNVMD